MEYKRQQTEPEVKPRIIIHGGAGNITPGNLPVDKYKEHREALLRIISRTNAFISSSPPPTALQIAVFAVSQLEDDPLFNAGHGAVFTRDGINECEASVMVSSGYSKRTAGVLGLKRVRNPIKLAAALLEHGDEDLAPRTTRLNVPSAQGHTMLHGETAEQLAADYGLDIVPESYYFTQKRYDEHLRGLAREKTTGSATYSAEEYLPQGTTGAVALDSRGVICAATSTGGLTNKLTGRLGDTPTPGAGFWAEEWAEGIGALKSMGLQSPEANTSWLGRISLSGAFATLLAECLPTPFTYTPVVTESPFHVTRAMGTSGTGNGDSFLRIAAGRTVGALAQFSPMSLASALKAVTGRGGKLERSAEDRFRVTGEGEGGMIGIERVVVWRGDEVVWTGGWIVEDFNCNGMFRAWIDDEGQAVVRVFREGSAGGEIGEMEIRKEDPKRWEGLHGNNTWMRPTGYRFKDI